MNHQRQWFQNGLVFIHWFNSYKAFVNDSPNPPGNSWLTGHGNQTIKQPWVHSRPKPRPSLICATTNESETKTYTWIFVSSLMQRKLSTRKLAFIATNHRRQKSEWSRAQLRLMKQLRLNTKLTMQQACIEACSNHGSGNGERMLFWAFILGSTRSAATAVRSLAFCPRFRSQG